MRHRSPSGLYSEADRKLIAVAETSAGTSLSSCNVKGTLSLELCFLTLRSLTLCALALSSLSPCFATDSAASPASNTKNAASANSALTDGPPLPVSAKSSRKHEKGLIAHIQPTTQEDENRDIKKDIKSAKKEASDSKNAKDSGGKETEVNDDTIQKNNVYASQYFDKIREGRKRKYAHASSTVQIYAPEPIVWKVLIDFEKYPEIFKRMDSCHITKREHGLLFAESYLKPQMFVKNLCQHTVTDISQGPHFLQWKMLDGNFSSVYGSWTLSEGQDKKGMPICVATYTLEADPGPVIPGPMVSFVLHQLEHEVVSLFKKACESTADGQPASKK